MNDPEIQLAASWIRAARSSPVTLDLQAVFSDVASQVQARGPACWASGRCCNFEQAGHRLYVTGLEAAYTIVRHSQSEGALSLPQIEAAKARGGCPFQESNLCGVHEIKPLGCRVYFCDRSAQEWQQRLSEHGLQQLRALHDRHGIEYRYGEWRQMLDMVVRALA